MASFGNVWQRFDQQGMGPGKAESVFGDYFTIFPCDQLLADTQRIWTLLSLMAVAAAIGLFAVASSTAVDRLALYLIPLQLSVGSRLPDTRLFAIPQAHGTRF